MLLPAYGACYHHQQRQQQQERYYVHDRWLIARSNGAWAAGHCWATAGRIQHHLLGRHGGRRTAVSDVSKDRRDVISITNPHFRHRQKAVSRSFLGPFS